MKKSTSPNRLRGRPRSEAIRRAILAATLRLLRTVTIQSVTMEAIAKAAGVSKATIYRWWPSKAAVVIDAFMEHHVVNTPMDAKVGAIEALTEHLVLLVQEYSRGSGRLVAQIIAEGQSDPAVLKTFRERFVDDRSELVMRVIEAGKKRGELRKDIPTLTMAECLYAPVYSRLLFGNPPLNRSFAERHAKIVLGLFKTPPRGPDTSASKR
ncbi:TetR/AcrR family transcriptional regulator [Bradyrhizobium sp. 200]|uniref:TetR/AcrR family transcriptional regulator n=1 Tax=Bradyrhizobium sp. 200 TaxID=2782665 RepID=UPI001FFEF54D|nr:TetR/AcrR family transcriptional regulator [Bradyrhizobium sp. 200]UPJ48389.1 TetR/AcrR family transcriptional regulator [Bradyrhizobium sp. 200]